MAYGYLYDDEMEMVLPGPSGSSSNGSHTPMKKESHSASVSLVD